MFVSFTKFAKKFGGIRFGLGLRITKSNVLWMSFVIMFVCMLQACWYMMLICFWLLYIAIYGAVSIVKKIINKLLHR